jgi:hypothetical protein
MAKVAIFPQVFQQILRGPSANCCRSEHQRQPEALPGMRLKSTDGQSIRMPRENDQISLPNAGPGCRRDRIRRK